MSCNTQDADGGTKGEGNHRNRKKEDKIRNEFVINLKKSCECDESV